ncbi:MAG: hypothetical protein K0R07_115 [Sedimentibacter sp.]|jgi:hypothetical protein|nr:hypothetical protein [Sedimentibacter sp.]
MKKRFIIIMLALLLFSYNSISAYEYHNEIDDIEYLLNERIKIMNEFLYGYKDMKSLEVKLNKIETEKLLDNDLDILLKVIDCPTDYELAKNVKVEEILTYEKVEDGIFINVDLNWLMSGYDGEFNMIKNYNIKLVEIEQQMYLAYMVINE